jgi:hypothetical protein
MTMFKVLELKGVGLIPATEGGRGYSTRKRAMAALKTYLKTFRYPVATRKAIIGGRGMSKACENAGFPQIEERGE